jgi:hypothetical protein
MSLQAILKMCLSNSYEKVCNISYVACKGFCGKEKQQQNKFEASTTSFFNRININIIKLLLNLNITPLFIDIM